MVRKCIASGSSSTPFSMPNATSITIGNTLSGTVVAPKADVVADMVTNATLNGAYFVQSFELHEGRFLRFSPFAGPWLP